MSGFRAGKIRPLAHGVECLFIDQRFNDNARHNENHEETTSPSIAPAIIHVFA
jgi:hypothetical protein